MIPELLERQKRFDTLLPRLVDAYSLIPSSEPADAIPLETHALSPLFGHVHDGLWTQLPTWDVSQVASRDTIALASAQCFDLLRQRQEEIRKFVRSLCYHVVDIRVRGEIHPQAMNAALGSARRPLLTALDQVLVPLEPILTAELIAQPIPVIRGAFHQWLQTSSRTVANQFILSMHKLVELDVIGIIEWPGERDCKLNFFRHTVLQDRVRSERTSKVGRNERGRMTVEEWEQLNARNRIFIERHEHHVMDAEAKELHQTKYAIPDEYRELIDRIPEWLQPHLRVLEGDLILERIVRWQSHEEKWDSKPKLRNVYEFQPEVRSAFEIDPAILLGHFVLTGWGQREVDREVHRRAREESAPQSATPAQPSLECIRESANLLFMANLAAVAAAVMMLFSRLQHRIMLPLSLLLSVVAIVALGRSLFLRSLGGDHRLNSVDVATQCLTRAFGLLAIQSALFGLLYGSWPMFGLAIPLWMVAGVTQRLSQSRQQD